MSIGRQLIKEDWCISRLIGETHLIFAKGNLRTLYDCGADKTLGKIIQVEEIWDQKKEFKTVDPAEMGGLEKIAILFEIEELKGLEKLLV